MEEQILSEEKPSGEMSPIDQSAAPKLTWLRHYMLVLLVIVLVLVIVFLMYQNGQAIYEHGL